MDRRTYLKASLLVGGGLLLPAGVLSLVGRHGVATTPELVGFDGKIMGTGYSVRLGAAALTLDNARLSAIAESVHRALQKVDGAMSTWRADSELSQFNERSNQDPQLLSAATFSVIEHALKISEMSNGAFDVTVGPLVDLWGFGAGASHFAKPTRAEVNSRLRQVGYNGINVDTLTSTIRKDKIASHLDLSGIAKGYAVDQVATVLHAEGFKNYLIEVGGELISSGVKPDGSAWRVAIESPQINSRDVFRVLDLNNKAIATSGDYRNFFIDGGQRYSHSIDPRTGQPIEHELTSVSVIAKSAMEADALSTAFMIMGAEAALSFAEQNQLAIHLILKSGNGHLKELFSSSLANYVSDAA